MLEARVRLINTGSGIFTQEVQVMCIDHRKEDKKKVPKEWKPLPTLVLSTPKRMRTFIQKDCSPGWLGTQLP